MKGMRIVAAVMRRILLRFPNLEKNRRRNPKMQRSLTQMQTQKPHILVFLQGYLELKEIRYMKIGRQPAGNN